jgi:hypothetical protein
MRRREVLGLSAAIAFASAGFAPAQAQWSPTQAKTWDPYAGVSALVMWFVNLNDIWKTKVVDPTEKAQLKDKVDKIRKMLHSCEAACRGIRDEITPIPPTETQLAELNTTVERLLDQIRKIRPLIVDLGNDLNMAISANRIDDLLNDQLNVRQRALFYVQRALNESQNGTWNSVEITEYLGNGIQAFKTAQVAAAQFEQTLT